MMDNYRTLFIATLLAICAVSTVNAAGAANSTTSTGPECGFQGNGDMYGLGIRLGIYIQGFATTISGAYRQESARGISFANGFYQFAMFIALTYMTVTDEAFQVVEAAIIVIFTFCSVAISSPEDLRFKRPKHINYMTIGQFCHHSLVPLGKLLVDLGLNCYTVWFWWMGIDILGHAPCTGYAFFFHQVSFYGWLRVLGRIGSILLVLVELWLVYRAIRNHIPKERATQGIFEWMTSPQRRHQNPRVNDVADFTGAVIGCCIIGFYIASVEMMILWNHVTEVDTVMGNMGQMIPFLIGVGSMVAVILEWGSIKEKTVATQTVLKEEIRVEKAADSGTPPVLQWEVVPVDLEKQAISETANDPQSSAGVGSEKQPVTASGSTPEGRLPYYKRFWRWINEPFGPQIHVISNDPTRVWRWYTV